MLYLHEQLLVYSFCTCAVYILNLKGMLHSIEIIHFLLKFYLDLIHKDLLEQPGVQAVYMLSSPVLYFMQIIEACFLRLHMNC